MATAQPIAPTTRERLLEAAFGVVAEGGYRAASVLAIAERADVAAGTLYRHFPSKAELFVEVFREVCDREIAAMRAADSGGDTPAGDRVVAVITTFATRALGNPRLAWALIAEPVDPAVDEERLSYRRAYRDLLAELLRDGIARGELPPQDPVLTAAAIVGAVGDAIAGPLAPGTAPDLDVGSTVAELARFVRRAAGA